MKAETKQTTTPKLANLIITIDAKGTSPLGCIQLLPDETITVYAVGLDEKGNFFAIPKDSIVHWSGGDGLEVKSTGAHSATVKLTKPLKAAVAKLSNRLPYEGKSFGSSVEIAQKVKVLPQRFSVVFLKDPTRDRTMDVEKMRVGESITVYLRGMSADFATMGEIFTLPVDASISWRAVPVPTVGAEIRITPIGCHSAKIEIVKPPAMEGMNTSMISVEVEIKDWGKTSSATPIEIVK